MSTQYYMSCFPAINFINFNCVGKPTRNMMIIDLTQDTISKMNIYGISFFQ